MLINLVTHLKMPHVCCVLGGFYIVVAICYLIRLVKERYFIGIWQQFKDSIIRFRIFLVIAFFGVVLLVSTVDLAVAHLAKHYFNSQFYTLIDFISTTAEGWFIGGVVFSIALIADILNQHRLAVLAKMSFTSILVAGLSNGILKLIINRERPVFLMQQWDFFHFFITKNSHVADLIYASNSMPSGHTIIVFAAIMPFVLATQKTWLKVLLFSYSGLICFSRIYSLNHWTSDVFVALILGILIGRACYLANYHRLTISNQLESWTNVNTRSI